MDKDQHKIAIALKKAHSSLERIIRDVEANQGCDVITQQTLAVIGLLKSVNAQMLERQIALSLESVKNLSAQKRSRIVREVGAAIRQAQDK